VASGPGHRRDRLLDSLEMKHPPGIEAGAGQSVAAPYDLATVGRALRQAREQQDVSQRELAPRCGVERTTIGKIEAGLLVPSVSTARCIERDLLVVPGAIFGDPRPCPRCGALNFASHCQGHGPKHAGPVTDRKDRKKRTPAGDRIRQARIACGWTQDKLGSLVGASGGRIAEIENGLDDPSGRLALSIETHLGLSGVFDLQPCPCRPGCPERTVGGKRAVGHHPQTEATRDLIAEAKRGVPRPDMVELFTALHEEDEQRLLALESEGKIDLKRIPSIVKTISGRGSARVWAEKMGIKPVAYEQTKLGGRRPIYLIKDIRDGTGRALTELIKSYGGDVDRARDWYRTRYGSYKTQVAFGRIGGRRNKEIAEASGKRVGPPRLEDDPERVGEVKKAASIALEALRRDSSIETLALIHFVALYMNGMREGIIKNGKLRDSRDKDRQKTEKSVRRLLGAAARLSDYSGTLLAQRFGE